MLLLYPLLAVLCYVAATGIEKRFLEKSRIPLATYLIQANLLLALFTYAVMLVAHEEVRWLSKEIWILFAIFAVLGGLKDLFFYSGFRGEPLSRVQFTTLFEPILVFVLAALIFPEERDPTIWFLAGIAVAGLAYGHFRHHHFTFDAKERILLLFIVAAAVKVMLAKTLLTDLTPMTLLFWECIFISLFHFVRSGFPWPALVPSHRTFGVAASMSLITAASLFLYGAYQALGVTLTSLVLLLKPVLNYFVAHFYFGERLDPKLLLGSTLILVTITYAFLYVV